MQTKINYLIDSYLKKQYGGIFKMSYSWYKLKDESWGIKIKDGTGTAGQQVTVTNSKGEEKTVKLNTRTAKFDDAELWSIEK